ncbi:MAG: DUF3631 domain-containing protein [Deltaproteobacteria bacterium]|nr:DUF3631 domain-containing protein [Deltaproteobacteria bacterium]
MAWRILDSSGSFLALHCRFELEGGGKTFRWWRNGRWSLQGLKAGDFLYGSELTAGFDHSLPVILTEGEKPCDALREIGVQAVGLVTGKGSTSISPKAFAGLDGCNLIFWPDAGEVDAVEFMERAARAALEAGAARAAILEPERLGLVEKGADAFDWVEGKDNLTAEDFLAVLKELAVEADRVESPAGALDPLEALRALPKHSAPSEVSDVLRVAVKNLPPGDRLSVETFREEALQALKGKASAPGRLVDAALVVTARGGAAEGQGQALQLDVPEPWHEEVDGAELLDEICETLLRYVVLPDAAEIGIALWLLLANVHDASEVSPLLAFCSPEKRCGKTTVLSLVGSLVPKPLPTSNITPAALFRAVEKFSPTLLVDEADSFLAGREDLRGILNSGHTRASAFVVRTVGEDHEPRRFGTWAPKAVAAIGSLPSTLEDRAILIPMRRKVAGEKVERLRLGRLRSQLQDLRRRAARWGVDNFDTLREADAEVPETLNDRAADNWRPLLGIADSAEGAWPELARRAARMLSGAEAAEDSSVRVQLLGDLDEIFQEAGTERIFTEELLQALHRLEDRPWSEWGRSKMPMTSLGLSRLLKPFEIKPRQIRIGRVTKKGYRLEDLSDAFRRYASTT